MRYYGIERKKANETLMYNLVKCMRFCSQYVTLNKEKRDQRKFNYNQSFVNMPKLMEKDLSIPVGKYYAPVCVITSDIVLREDIPKIKSGLIKLLKKHYSHKFLSHGNSIEKILEIIDKMDDTLTSWYNSVEIGRFDFENDVKLKEKISFFDVYIKNLNSSYLLIEFHLYCAENYIKNQVNIINGNYVKKDGFIMPGFGHNRKVSGGRRIYGVVNYNNAHLKSDHIFEDILKMKWQFYNKIQKYFVTILHQKSVNPPSINVYKTNLPLTGQNMLSFWDSVGISCYQGQLIDESRKLYFKTNLSQRYEHQVRTDMIYVVNEHTFVKLDEYYSVDYQMVFEFKDTFNDSLLRFELLRALNDITAKELISYKQILNRIKLKRDKLHKLLKLRYHFEKDIDYYRRFASEDIWKEARNTISGVFDVMRLSKSNDYSILTESSIDAKNKINEQINTLSNEFNDKTNILQHLVAYKNESRIKVINYLMLFLALSTLVFIIYPDLAKIIGEYIIEILDNIRRHLNL